MHAVYACNQWLNPVHTVGITCLDIQHNQFSKQPRPEIPDLRSVHMRTSYCSLSVCVFVSVTILAPACNNLNLPARSSLNCKGYQLADFAKKLSFPSYSLFFTFAQPRRPFSIIQVATWQGQLTTITYEC